MPTKLDEGEIQGDPLNYYPPKLQAREDHIKESWVRAMEARLVREELEKCQKAEGVNHYENCKWLSEKYLQMLRNNQVKGYKHIDV